MGADLGQLIPILNTLSLMRTDTKAILTAISTVAGADYELRATTYKANKVGTGYTTSDFIQRTDIINAVTGIVSTTVYFNETAGTVIAAPPIADLDPYTPPSHIVIDSGVITSITNAVAVTLPSGTQTITSSSETGSTNSPVATGATSVGFTTSSTYSGNINGVAGNTSTFYGFESAPGKTLPAITYTVTAGSVRIDKIV